VCHLVCGEAAQNAWADRRSKFFELAGGQHVSMGVVNVLTLMVVRDHQRPENVVRPAADDSRYADLESDDADDEGEDFLVGERELLIVIDGVSELDRWDGLGLDPDDLLNPELPLLPPVDGTPVQRIVQRCGCGDIGCGSLTTTIRRTGDAIEWTELRDRGESVGVGPFRFDAEQYEREVRRAHRDRPWESRTERIARMVGDALRDHRDQRPRSFDWASGSPDNDHVVVSLSDTQPNPKAGQPKGPRREAPGGGYWQGVELPEIVEQHVGRFAISTNVDDALAAEEVVERVLNTDPATWLPP
jgi:hypothetical protein